MSKFYAIVADENNDSLGYTVQNIKGKPMTLLICETVKEANKFMVELIEHHPEARVVEVKIEII